MNYAKIRNFDIANGEGVRVSLFVSGCTNSCPGCFNAEEKDFNYGKPYTGETREQIVQMLDNPNISGLSILGGDPLCQDYWGILNLRYLCSYVHTKNKNVWMWTGFKWEDFTKITTNPFLQGAILNLISECDVVIDGPFIQELYSPSLKWRGSSNQRVIDIRKTFEKMGNEIVPYLGIGI